MNEEIEEEHEAGKGGGGERGTGRGEEEVVEERAMRRRERQGPASVLERGETDGGSAGACLVVELGGDGFAPLYMDVRRPHAVPQVRTLHGD